MPAPRPNRSPGRSASRSRTCSSCSGRSASCSWPRSATASSGHGSCSTKPPTRRPTDDQTCSILDLMGAAYMRLLADRDLLRVQLQAYAACGDDDVRQVVREEFASLYASVKQRQRRVERGDPPFLRRGDAAQRGGRPRARAARRRRGRSAASWARARPTPAGEVPPDDRRSGPLFSSNNLVTTNSRPGAQPMTRHPNRQPVDLRDHLARPVHGRPRQPRRDDRPAGHQARPRRDRWPTCSGWSTPTP